MVLALPNNCHFTVKFLLTHDKVGVLLLRYVLCENTAIISKRKKNNNVTVNEISNSYNIVDQDKKVIHTG